MKADTTATINTVGPHKHSTIHKVIQILFSGNIWVCEGGGSEWHVRGGHWRDTPLTLTLPPFPSRFPPHGNKTSASWCGVYKAGIQSNECISFSSRLHLSTPYTSPVANMVYKPSPYTILVL